MLHGLELNWLFTYAMFYSGDFLVNIQLPPSYFDTPEGLCTRIIRLVSLLLARPSSLSLARSHRKSNYHGVFVRLCVFLFVEGIKLCAYPSRPDFITVRSVFEMRIDSSLCADAADGLYKHNRLDRLIFSCLLTVAIIFYQLHIDPLFTLICERSELIFKLIFSQPKSTYLYVALIKIWK